MSKLSNKKYCIIQGILVFLFFWFSAYLQLIPIYLFKLNSSKISYHTEVILSVFSSICVIIVLFFIYRKELLKEWTIFKNNIMENMDIAFKYWFLGLLFMMVSNYIIGIFFKVGGAANEEILQKMIHSLPWLMVVNAGFLAPFNEEIVFRKVLKDIFDNKYVFIFLSFLLFGLAHVVTRADNVLDYLYVIPYGALGAAFAISYQKTNT